MHAFWEIVASNALVVLAMAAGVALLGRLWKNPAALHLLWVLVLVKLVTPPAVTVPIFLPVSRDVISADAHQTDGGVGDRPVVVVSEEAHFAASGAQSPRESPDRASPADGIASIGAASPVVIRQGTDWLTVLAWTWGTGTALIAFGYAVRIARFRQLLRAGRPPSSTVLSMAQRVGTRLGLRQIPAIAMLPVRLSPMVWSVGCRPRVLLPAAFFERLDADSQESILTHELSHDRRKDHWIRLLELTLATLFWWHPVVWWACHRLRELEEECCDCLVLNTMPHGARVYAAALLDTADFLSEGAKAAPLGATAAWSSVTLARRISMLKNRTHVLRLTIGNLVVLAAVAGVPMAMAFAVALPENGGRYIDLQGKANWEVKEFHNHRRPGNDLAGLPKGDGIFGNVKFRVGNRCIQLAGTLLPDSPRKVQGIEVGAPFRQIEFLHATAWGGYGEKGDPQFVEDGTQIGQYTLHYEDGSRQSIPIVYGEDVRDFWNWDNSKPCTRGKVVWTGKNEACAEEGLTLRLYLTTWQNPKPGVKVTHIDYSSEMKTAAAPFCIAISTDNEQRLGRNTGTDRGGKPSGSPTPVAASDQRAVERRAIHKLVKDFPEKTDLSTPESAMAAWYRAGARTDDPALLELSWIKWEPRHVQQLQDDRKSHPEETAIFNEAQRNAELLEVLTYRDDYAAVICKLKFPEGVGRDPYDRRHFGKINGVWKNLGDSRLSNVAAAREEFEATKDKGWEDFAELRENVRSGRTAPPRRSSAKRSAPIAPGQPLGISVEKADLMGRIEWAMMHGMRDVTARRSIEWGEIGKNEDGNRTLRYKYYATIWDKDVYVMNQVYTFDANGNILDVEDVEGFPQKKVDKPVNVTTQAGMKELVQDFFTKNFRDVTSREDIQWGEVMKAENGNSSIRYQYRAKIWDKETKIMNQVFTFDPKGKFVSVKNMEGFPKNP